MADDIDDDRNEAHPSPEGGDEGLRFTLQAAVRPRLIQPPTVHSPNAAADSVACPTTALSLNPIRAT